MSVWRGFEAIGTGQRIQVVGAGGAALATIKSTEMAVRAKASRHAEVPCLAAEASVVEGRSGGRGNGDTGLRIHEADAGIVAGLGNRVLATDCGQGDVGDGVEH